MAKNDRDQIRRLREEANTLRQQAEAKKRRQRMLTQVGTIVGALVAVAIVVVFAVMGPQWFGNRNVPKAEGTIPMTTSTGSAVDVPITISDAGIEVGLAEAPNTIDYYLDFSCPHCREYHTAMDSTYRQLIADGEIRINYHYIRFVDDYGMRAGGAMTAAVQADPASYFTVVDDLFSVDAQTQVSWNEGDYASHIQTLGVTDEAVIGQIEHGDYNWWILESTRNARQAGINATPSILLNGALLQNLPTPDTIQSLLGGTGSESTEAPAASETPAATESTGE